MFCNFVNFLNREKSIIGIMNRITTYPFQDILGMEVCDKCKEYLWIFVSLLETNNFVMTVHQLFKVPKK